MKKVLYWFFGLIILFALSSCGEEVKSSNSIHVPKIDVHNDMEEYQEEDNKTYYKSKYVSFVREVKGYFQTNVPFTISEDENIRIYDDLYFYEGDLFYLCSSDYKYIWASLTNENISYASVLREQGEDIRVDIKKDGIYKVTLDMKTMLMELNYKSEITTPYYYPFETICIGVLKNGSIADTNLIPNPSNEDEFYITDYEAEAGKLYSFYSSFTFTSTYKLTISDSAKEYLDSSMYSNAYLFKVSGKYNIYVNKKTYEIRVELNPASATYYCLVYEGGFVELECINSDTPYIFEYQYEATADYGGYGLVSDDLPKFYSKNYKEYTFNVLESDLLGDNNGKYYFKKKGLYKVTVDVLNLTLQVEKIEA